jgi:peroxiredoxin (alkyl hydroperoxide reductase subunit C)
MRSKKTILFVLMGLAVFLFLDLSVYARSYGRSNIFKEDIYEPGSLKPKDSILKVKVGDRAPDFSLPAISGGKVSLSQYLNKMNVVLSFVPAAWTPVCSDQWPGYNIVKYIFDQHDTVLLGITVDNVPTLFAWSNRMIPDGGNLWFPVLSDFWPHGAVADKYGILRSDGMSERAIFVIDKKGVIQHIDIHDINKRPPLEGIVRELEKLQN